MSALNFKLKCFVATTVAVIYAGIRLDVNAYAMGFFIELNLIIYNTFASKLRA